MKKPKVSMFALISRSPRWAKFIYNSLIKNTPEFKNGDAEFYFIVNFKEGVSDKLITYLDNKQVPYYVFRSKKSQLNYPYNMKEIYQAWNHGAKVSNGEFICPINSDMYPAPNWLSELIKNYSDDKIVSSRLVESGRMPSGLHGITRNFGKIPEKFEAKKFEEYAETITVPTLQAGGLYMPYLLKKESFSKILGYPEGNLNGIPGDQVFIQRLSSIGIHHYTCFSSIVYHVQEGESKDEEV